MQEAHRLARECLGAAAERRKLNYDLRVKNTEFQVGDWTYYYYPRRYAHRSPKWSKNYIGPYLVVKKIPPCDYVIQRTKRSTPIVTHGNKLKHCRGPVPASWLKSDEPKPAVSEEVPEGVDLPDDRPTASGNSQETPKEIKTAPKKKEVPIRREDVKHRRMEDAIDELIKSRRNRRVPDWMKDYEC